MDIPNLVSISGQLVISASGELSGSFAFVNIIDVSKDIRDSSTVEVQGNMMPTKNEITLNQNVTYTRSDGTGGDYTAFGALLRQLKIDRW